MITNLQQLFSLKYSLTFSIKFFFYFSPLFFTGTFVSRKIPLFWAASLELHQCDRLWRIDFKGVPNFLVFKMEMKRSFLRLARKWEHEKSSSRGVWWETIQLFLKTTVFFLWMRKSLIRSQTFLDCAFEPFLDFYYVQFSPSKSTLSWINWFNSALYGWK